MANYTEWITEQRDTLKAEVETLATQNKELATSAMRLAADNSRLESEVGAAKAKEAAILLILQKIAKLLPRE